jgi:hypothetical protein
VATIDCLLSLSLSSTKRGGEGELQRAVEFYKDGAPQQPAKGVLLVRESRTRRVRRFTTERPGACPAARLEGNEQSWQRTDGPK